jgi:hypothetical protein
MVEAAHVRKYLRRAGVRRVDLDDLMQEVVIGAPSRPPHGEPFQIAPGRPSATDLGTMVGEQRRVHSRER